MSETLPVEPGKILKSKIGGVPFAALAGIVVVGTLGYGWWRKRNQPAPPVDTTTGGAEGNADESQPLFLANPGSTLTGAAVTVPTATTNEQWAQLAIQWLVTSRGMSATDAARVIQDYLAGIPQSTADGAMRDAAVAQFGLPPNVPTVTGTLNPPRPSKQGTPPCLHYVQGNGDGTSLELSYLYFGNAGYAEAIAQANPGTGEPYAPGTAVQVPAVSVTAPPPPPTPTPTPAPTPGPNVPKYRRYPAGKRVSDIIRENGISTLTAFRMMNPTLRVTDPRGHVHTGNDITTDSKLTSASMVEVAWRGGP